jgi:hypothetical protein
MIFTKESSFRHNDDYFSNSDKNLLKNGGALTFRGRNLYVRECLAKGNQGFRGGFIFVDCLLEKYQSVIIRKSVFASNNGGNGGVIGFTYNVKMVDVYIFENYFTKNSASSMKIKFQKIINSLLFFEFIFLL